MTSQRFENTLLDRDIGMEAVGVGRGLLIHPGPAHCLMFEARRKYSGSHHLNFENPCGRAATFFSIF